MGESRFLTDEQREVQQQLGVVPLFVISGLHINLFCRFLHHFLLRIGIRREQSQLLLIISLMIYAIFVGLGISVMRVVLMRLFSFVGKVFHQSFSSLDYFMFSVMFMLVLQPFILFNMGFQLSYGVTAMFLLIHPFIQKLPPFKQAITLSFVASFFSFPILAFHFFEVPLLSVAFNLILMPLFEWVLIPLCYIAFFVAIFFSNISMIMDSIQFLTTTFFQALDTCLLYLTELPFLTFITGRLEVIFIIVFYMGFLSAFLTFFSRQHFVRFLIQFTFCCISVLYFSLFLRDLHFQGEIMMIDIGQGDAILIRLPKNQGNFLIDTGGQMTYPKEEWRTRRNQKSIAQKVLIPYLKSEGISRLDGVFITHAHLDHYGELEELSKSIQIKEVVFPSGSEKQPSFGQVLQSVARQKTVLTPVLGGARYMKNGLKIDVLYPFLVEDGGNNDSLVLYMVFDGVSWLFTGDLEKDGEQLLLATYPNLTADVLKMGHHGSKTSSTDIFLAQIQPRYSLISCGKNNRFSHPSEEVLERAYTAGIDVYRTDLNGGIYYPMTSSNQVSKFQTILAPD